MEGGGAGDQRGGVSSGPHGPVRRTRSEPLGSRRAAQVGALLGAGEGVAILTPVLRPRATPAPSLCRAAWLRGLCVRASIPLSGEWWLLRCKALVLQKIKRGKVPGTWLHGLRQPGRRCLEPGAPSHTENLRGGRGIRPDPHTSFRAGTGKSPLRDVNFLHLGAVTIVRFPCDCPATHKHRHRFPAPQLPSPAPHTAVPAEGLSWGVPSANTQPLDQRSSSGDPGPVTRRGEGMQSFYPGSLEEDGGKNFSPKFPVRLQVWEPPGPEINP